MGTTCVCLWIGDTPYFVEPRSVREVDPSRYLCRAWKHDPDGESREVQNLGRLDKLARMLCEFERVSEDGRGCR